MVKAALVTKEVNPYSCHLPNTHLFMLWGVEPIWSVDHDSDTIYSHHLFDYIYRLDICAPLLPGVTVIPSTVNFSLPRDQEPDPTPLSARRVYILGYLPVLFFSQLTTRILSALVAASSTGASPPTSPGNSPPYSVAIPFEMPSGLRVYLWRRNVFLEDVDGSKLWIHLTEGKQVGPESLPHTGRLDIFVQADLQKEATWLRLVTQEIDYVSAVIYSRCSCGYVWPPSSVLPCEVVLCFHSSVLVSCFIPIPSCWSMSIRLC